MRKRLLHKRRQISNNSQWKQQLRTECGKRVRQISDDWQAHEDLMNKKSKIHLELKKLMLEDQYTRKNLEECYLVDQSDYEVEEYQAFVKNLEEEILKELATAFEQGSTNALFNFPETDCSESQQLEEKVLCPLCQTNYLFHEFGRIYCCQDQYMLSGQHLDWSLETVRSTLAATVEKHREQNCTGTVQFKVRSHNGNYYIYSFCSICQFQEVMFEVESWQK